ncbi:MAG: tRNA lysidine(34) synthetase TilS [Reyranellales bacterium]
MSEAASRSLTGPLTASDFAPLMAPFEPFESEPCLAVAVSGGRDSLCLAMLAQAWAAARGGRVLALIVDHGLRAGSAGEAAATRDLLATRGVAGEILQWTGAKPTGGLQEAARVARYRLLFEACRRHRLLHLLVAHHAEDQAETVTMRAARGSGPDGLAGMAALVERPEARLLRPLLGMPRPRLTATVAALGMRWIDDPSNADLRFERARLRKSDTPGLVSRTGDDGRRTENERRLAQAAVETLEFDREGAVAIDRSGFEGLGVDLAARLLSRVVQATGGRDHPPRRDRLARATARLSQAIGRGKSGNGQDFTLSGCRLTLRQEPAERRLRWIVWPENGRTNRRKAGQPLVPAAFFACGAPAAPHVD